MSLFYSKYFINIHLFVHLIVNNRSCCPFSHDGKCLLRAVSQVLRASFPVHQGFSSKFIICLKNYCKRVSCCSETGFQRITVTVHYSPKIWFICNIKTKQTDAAFCDAEMLTWQNDQLAETPPLCQIQHFSWLILVSISTHTLVSPQLRNRSVLLPGWLRHAECLLLD